MWFDQSQHICKHSGSHNFHSNWFGTIFDWSRSARVENYATFCIDWQHWVALVMNCISIGLWDCMVITELGSMCNHIFQILIKIHFPHMWHIDQLGCNYRSIIYFDRGRLEKRYIFFFLKHVWSTLKFFLPRWLKGRPGKLGAKWWVLSLGHFKANCH